jgi:dTDP-glucose pyrophosphorylase
MYTDLTNLCIKPENSMHEAIAQIEVSRIGIVLVIDPEFRLLGTVTDGDLRRMILAGISLDEPVSVLLARKTKPPFSKPIAAQVGAGRTTFIKLLNQYSIRHLPLVDHDQRVVALVTSEDFTQEPEPPMQAVIMAGGMGTRMHPLTENLPKPMLPVGNQPLMEIIVNQLRDADIKHVNVSVHHKSEKITDYFGDGSKFGVEITYVTEEQPLGTAGALGLMEVPQETVLVINGDILTQVDFRAMRTYHQEQNADLTVAVLQYELQVPYGIVECKGTSIQSISEKPLLKFFVNAGIYLLEPTVYNFIPKGERYDMTDLIQQLLNEGRSVVAFPIREYWSDIGQHSDYEQAQEQMKQWQWQQHP